MLTRREFLKGLGAVGLGAVLARYHGGVVEDREGLVTWGRENGVVRPQWQGWGELFSEVVVDSMVSEGGYIVAVDRARVDRPTIYPSSPFLRLEKTLDCNRLIAQYILPSRLVYKSLDWGETWQLVGEVK